MLKLHIVRDIVVGVDVRRIIAAADMDAPHGDSRPLARKHHLQKFAPTLVRQLGKQSAARLGEGNAKSLELVRRLRRVEIQNRHRRRAVGRKRHNVFDLSERTLFGGLEHFDFHRLGECAGDHHRSRSHNFSDHHA